MITKRFSGYGWFQDLRRVVQSPKPKSDQKVDPKCAYGGMVTSLRLSPKGLSIYYVVQIWGPERPPPLCNIVINFDNPPIYYNNNLGGPPKNA